MGSVVQEALEEEAAKVSHIVDGRRIAHGHRWDDDEEQEVPQEEVKHKDNASEGSENAEQDQQVLPEGISQEDMDEKVAKLMAEYEERQERGEDSDAEDDHDHRHATTATEVLRLQ